MPVKRRCSLRKLFNAIDADGSGEVTLAEVTKAFKKAAGKDELLTYNEFSKMCRIYPKGVSSKVRRGSARRGGEMVCSKSGSCKYVGTRRA